MDRAAGKPKFNLIYILVFIWVIILARDLVRYGRDYNAIPYSEFLTDLDQGKITEVIVSQDRIEGTFKEAAQGQAKNFFATRVEDPNLAEKLKKANVKFTGTVEGGFFKGLLSWLFPLLFFMGIFYLLSGRLGGGAGAPRGGGFLPLGRSKAKVYVEKDLKTRFEDVAGVDEAKQELAEIVDFLKTPARYTRLGGRMPKGVLLVGPPGTGKTLLARAVAGEARVPFFFINGSEFVELFVGLGAARVRDLFEQARSNAPCIIFIDELDALGKARGLSAITGSAGDEKEQTLNQLLAELDGFDPSSGIVLLAATNRPEVLDPALLRAGRFDRHVFVDKPDRLGRRKILEIHLKKVTLAAGTNLETVASLTPGFSGADLANLANEAALIATRRGAESVELHDFTEAIERVVAGLERKNRVLSPDEKKRVAYHEMGHTLVALALGEGEAVHKVSIIPRGIGALGYTLRRPTEDRYLVSRADLKNKMAVALGGRAAELFFFPDISTGAADDLDQATDLARAMITRYGMSDRLGLAIFERESSPLLGVHGAVRNFEYSEKTAEAIDREIESLLEGALSRASQLVRDYRAMIEDGVRILLVDEKMDEAAIKALWEKHHGKPPAIGVA